MQYPQIQFYKGSLVRLASGKLKQVEDLNSDDFLESARLACFGQKRLSYLDSSVVKDFLEVGPPSPPSAFSSSSSSSSSTSPSTLSASSALSFTLGHHQIQNHQQQLHPNSPTPPLLHNSNQTVLIKFFLESSKQIVFIEVPIERPFFVFHRGWSSWNPQITYDKFGLKCRKLKIGDTCISLIKRKQQQQTNNNNNTNNKQQQQQLQDSDQCNILFSSIKINE